MRLYTIYDDLAGQCTGVFAAESDALAIRQALVATRGVDPIIRGDFRLVYLGELDEHKPSITPPMQNGDIISESVTTISALDSALAEHKEGQ